MGTTRACKNQTVYPTGDLVHRETRGNTQKNVKQSTQLRRHYFSRTLPSFFRKRFPSLETELRFPTIPLFLDQRLRRRSSRRHLGAQGLLPAQPLPQPVRLVPPPAEVILRPAKGFQLLGGLLEAVSRRSELVLQWCARVRASVVLVRVRVPFYWPVLLSNTCFR